MSARSYRQHCGLARALDLLGERWTLLIVRELALGPKRFRDLLERLPGIGTNLLSARLRALQAANVVEHTTLPPPAGVAAYELTERGRGLEPALEHLATWGLELLPAEPGEGTASAAWLALTMRAAARGRDATAAAGTYELEIGPERLHISAGLSGVEVRDGPSPMAPDVRLRCDLRTLYELGVGALTPAGAVRARRATIEGDRARLEALLGVLRLPRPATASRV